MQSLIKLIENGVKTIKPENHFLNNRTPEYLEVFEFLHSTCYIPPNNLYISSSLGERIISVLLFLALPSGVALDATGS